MGDTERPTRSDWEALAAKEVKGDLDKLTWITPEGIPVQPLYTAEDLEGLEGVGTLPGIDPFVRGVRATMEQGYGRVLEYRRNQISLTTPPASTAANC